jgi:UDP-glucuronate 4-epimerase
VELEHYINVIEGCLGKKAKRNLLPLQPGDVIATWADVEDLARDLDYRPNTPVEVGIKRFVEWYKDYYGVA